MKRKRSMSKPVMAFLMTVMLVMQMVPFAASVYAVGADKTAVIGAANPAFPLEVKQNNTVVAVNDADNGVIQGRQSFTLTLTDLNIPVKGDNQEADDATIILKGDTVVFDKATFFPMLNLTSSGSSPINIGGQTIATAAFAADKITLTFNGDDSFFNGVKKDVKISLATTAKADLSQLSYGSQVQTLIFGLSYYMANPALTPMYSLAITALDSVKPSQYGYVNLNAASFTAGTITWRVNVAAFDQDDNTIPLPLDGKTFYDDLTDGSTFNAPGVYVPDSFTVDGEQATPVYADGALSYTFPDVSTPEAPRSSAIVEFKTWIPKALYYYEYHTVPASDGGVKIASIAQLKDEDTVLASGGSYRVNLYPDWIQSSGKVSKSGEDTLVTWTIDVNRKYGKTGLNSFAITDELPAGLSFVSAAYQLWDTSDWSATETPISPDEATGSLYEFGNIEGPVRLVIVSKVVSGNSFTNLARVNWNLATQPAGVQHNDAVPQAGQLKYPYTVSDDATVTVGAHGFTKGAAISQEDFNNAMVTWQVNLSPQYEVPDMAVYDLLVYGDSIDFAQLDSAPAVDAAVLSSIKNNLDARVKRQQYKPGSFVSDPSNADVLTLEVIPLKINNITVADLLKVTGYGEQAASFSFRTVLNDPNQFAGQRHQPGQDGIKYVFNRAFLFEGSSYTSRADSTINYHASMLTKGMLYASKPLKPDGYPDNAVSPNNANSYIAGDGNDAYTMAAYDRVSKTVTFRLAVNMPGFDTDKMAIDGGSRVATNIKLVDTLPPGWEFVPFSPGLEFELWKGSSNNGSGTGYGVYNTANEKIEPGDPRHVASFSHDGNVGTFSFAKLESPYVILVKARPTAATMEGLLASGEATYQGTNNAELKITWGGVEKVTAESRKVIVPLSSLTKTVSKPTSGVQEWTVNYAPSFAMPDGVYLEDTLGAGLKLREDVNGGISLTPPDMAVYRAAMTPGGALLRDGAALDLTGSDPEVKVEMVKSEGQPTKLKFTLKNPNQTYQIVYQTESSGMDVGATAGNHIRLLGGQSLPEIEASSSIQLDGNDVSGSAGSNGVLHIKKVGPDGTSVLKDVQFSLYEADGVTPAKNQQNQPIKGTTDSSGKLMLLIPNPGLYQLKQTYIDENTYLPTTTVYPVRVADVKDSPTFADGALVTSNDPLVVPTPDAGKLLVKNTVEGNAGNAAKEFAYTVVFTGEGADGSYAYTKTGGANGSIASGAVFTLKHDETLTLPVLPAGLGYSVVQIDYGTDGYSTNPGDLVQAGSIPSSVPPSGGIAEAFFVNTRNTGDLLIGNTVIGGDPDQEFEYTVEFVGIAEGGSKDYTYTRQDNSTGTIKSGGTIKLKHNETALFKGVLTGTGYTVTQKDYTEDGYTTDPTSLIRYGSIETGIEKTAGFVSTAFGNLLIGNTVTGSGGEPGKEFEYTVTFTGTGASEEYVYDKSDNTSDIIKSGDKIKLKDGQTITVKQLPAGLQYTVIQTNYSADDYATLPGNLQQTGSIAIKSTSEAGFINNKDLPGGLLIGNTVTGNGGELDKVFEYTITFTGPGAGKTYSYTKPGGGSGTIQSGGTLELKHGQTVTIEGIYKDTGYTVVEADYSTDGYTTEPGNRTFTGTIVEMEIAEARYENARYLPGTLALEAAPKKVPGDGVTPSELTATLTGTDGQPVKDKEIVFKQADGTEIGRATTDKDGKARISFTPKKLSATTPKDYEIVATTTATSPSGVPYEEAKDTVTAMPAALTGILRDNSTGKAIPNAAIVIKNVGTGEEVTIATDSEGKYYHPVQRDEEYTITYTRMIPIGGTAKSIPFTQKAIIENTDTTTEGNLIPAKITAVGIVLFKQPDGQTAQFDSAMTNKMHIYLKDANGEYVKGPDGKPKAFDMEDAGTFAAEGLTEQTYTMEVRYEVAPGTELTLTTAKLNVKADGELNISEELVDPYGTVYDKTTGDADTGKKIENAEVRLYFANTQRNIDKGYVPGTQVDLPPVPGFPPHDNKSTPWQPSDANGFYAFMVFPEADYYLVVTKNGYERYKSTMISVEFDIVKHDVPMIPISTDVSNPGPPIPDPDKPAPVDPEPENPGPVNPEPDHPEPVNPDPGSLEPVNPGTDNPDVIQPGPEDNNGTDNNGGHATGSVKKDKVPKTGDSGTPPGIWMALAFISLIMLGLLLLGGRKKRI